MLNEIKDSTAHKIVDNKIIIELTEEQLEKLAAGYKPTLVWARYSDVPSYDPEQ